MNWIEVFKEKFKEELSGYLRNMSKKEDISAEITLDYNIYFKILIYDF